MAFCIGVPNAKFLASPVPEIWRGSQNYKNRSCDPYPIPIDLCILHLHFFVSAPHGYLFICVSNLEFLTLAVPEIKKGSKILKVGHLTAPDPLWHNFAFFRYCPSWSLCKPNLKFLALTIPEIEVDVSSFNSSGDRWVPKF